MQLIKPGEVLWLLQKLRKRKDLISQKHLEKLINFKELKVYQDTKKYLLVEKEAVIMINKKGL